VSESPGYGQPESNGPSANADQSRTSGGEPPRSNSSSGNGGSSTGGNSGGSQSARRSDPVADFQRWLMRAGARSMANQVADQVKKTIGQERRSTSGDVWDTATTELPPEESPECQWCPICQAARAARTSGPGLGARLADVGGVLGTVVGDAFSAFEQALKVQEQNAAAARARVPAPGNPAPGNSDTNRDGDANREDTSS
jgi:hypothetical protein